IPYGHGWIVQGYAPDETRKCVLRLRSLWERCSAISTRSCSTASVPTQSSRTCCCTPVRGPQSTGLSTSTLLVEDSLNLAYGARAEQQGFTITLERSLDPAAGQVDCFPHARDHAGSSQPDLKWLRRSD